MQTAISEQMKILLMDDWLRDFDLVKRLFLSRSAREKKTAGEAKVELVL